MVRVLILTASYGSGHNIAAESLAAAFRREGVAVTVVDHFRDLVHPRFEGLSRRFYYWILRRAPAAWGIGYALGDRMAADSPLAFGVTRLGTARLAGLIQRLAPDLVVTVHATPAVALSWLARGGLPVPPHTCVITDFVAHRQWIASHVDRFCVPAAETRHEFIARGVPHERIAVTGIPLRPEFETPGDRLESRRALGLWPRSPLVLAMAGAQGSLGRLLDVARLLAEPPQPLQAVVVTGQDRELLDQVGRLTRGTPVRVLGWVPDVHRLMQAADILVTKAGGMTIAEAMAMELPLLTYGSLPGQERRNERFAARAGIAVVARSRRELREALTRALNDLTLLEHLRRQMRRLRRPDASRRIVAAVLERREIVP